MKREWVLFRSSLYRTHYLRNKYYGSYWTTDPRQALRFTRSEIRTLMRVFGEKRTWCDVGTMKLR